ncbi:MAG: BspA family leucine-rich repeat surface protein [Alistipes sp.]|nr:BspA family leucine-rich repeat surface protein [Alistipes sp.]
MAKNDNLTDFLVDVADAIREKKGISGEINPQDFSAEIASIESGGGNGWTGHADAEGLRAIGWTDEDIAYYQENGVDWNEEDDHLHLVSDDNKALYGVLTAYNISTYKDRIVYLPKIDTSALTSMSYKFNGCREMVALPFIDTSRVTNMSGVFNACYSLRTIPPIDFSKAQTSDYAFWQCLNLRRMPPIDTSSATNLNGMFYQCVSLEYLHPISLASATNVGRMFHMCGKLKDIEFQDSHNVSNWSEAFYTCLTLESIDGIDMRSATTTQSLFGYDRKLHNLMIRNLKTPLDLAGCFLLSKESILNFINNEVATSPITMTLATNVYDKYATDPDIVEALANHPNITLAK